MASYSKTLTDSAAILDRHSWNEMILTWDDYTGTWDSYGELTITSLHTHGRTLTDAITNTDAIQKILTMHKTLSDAITHTETISKLAVRNLTDSITHTQIFEKIATVIREIDDWLPLSPYYLIKIIKKPETETITMTEAITRNTIKRISEVLGLADIYQSYSTYIRTLTDAIGITEYDWTWDKMTLTWDDYTQEWDAYRNSLWIRIITLKTYSDTLQFADYVLRKPIKIVSDTLSHSEAITRIIKLFRTEILNLAENLLTRANLGIVIIDYLQFTENITTKFREYFLKARGRIKNVIFSGIIRSEKVDGNIRNTQTIVGKISQIKPEGKIEDQTIIGKIDQS